MQINKTLFFKAGSVSLMLLGALHLVAHFFMLAQEDVPPIINDMHNFKIEMLGQHTLLQFHNGFSITMGFLLFAYGFQNMLLAAFFIQHKKSILLAIVISLITFFLALIYFHVLAYGLLLLAMVFYLVAFFNTKTR